MVIAICLWVITTPLYAQNPALEAGRNPYLGIISYEGGITTGGAFYVTIIKQWGINLDVENWKLSVKLTGNIQAADGTIFPAEKISFIPIGTEGSGPSVSQIGMPSAVPLNGLSEVFLVPNSQAPLDVGIGYYQYHLKFAIAAAGGAYLEHLQATSGNKRYTAPLQFTLYDGNNNIIARANNLYNNIEVHRLSGSPPGDGEQYSISVSTEASNGLLEFTTISDYINGKSITYADGLSVSATTPYQVKVKSIDPYFSSVSLGNTTTLDLDVVRLQLSSSSLKIPLSQTPQTILAGPSTGGSVMNFDITYSIEGNNPKLFNVPPDLYQTSLTYEITPQ